MIKDIWSLKFEGEILGVRVQTVRGEYYDIDIDVYTKQLNLNPKDLKKSLRLLEVGDLFMTEEEFDTGLVIEDGSHNTRLLHAVNTFVRSSMKDDPIYKERRAKKILELKNAYGWYLPHKWLNDFAEYHIDNFEGNKNIYNSLTKGQLKIVREYFRWRTKLMFDEAKHSKVLRKSLKKARELVALMGDAEDWYYDGSVDTGAMGLSHCELGHALRYEHYAYSPSLDKHIIFGATCMSDFFEVDKKVLDNINRAQEMLLKEIKVIVFVMKTGREEEYSKEYKDLWDILRYFKGQFNDLIPNGSGWSYFIGGFVKQKLPLTKSMRDQYKKLQWKYQQALEEERRANDPEYREKMLQKERQAEEQKARAQAEVNNPSNPYEDILTRIEQAGDAGVIPKTLFAFTIIPTIRRYGRMSPRQKVFIDEALNKIPDDFKVETKSSEPVTTTSESEYVSASSGVAVSSRTSFTGGSSGSRVVRNIGADGVDYTDIF